MLTLSTNNLLIRAITLVGGGALLLSTLGLAEAKAQGTETVEQFNEQLPNAQLLAQQRVVPPLGTRLPSRASLGAVESDSVSVTLTNNSPSVITYQSTSIATETLELMPGEQQTFDDINAPMNLVFYQKDGGLTSAQITNVNRREDSFEVELTGADTLNADNRTVVLLSSGNIYIY
jgi:hypothetical protein